MTAAEVEAFLSDKSVRGRNDADRLDQVETRYGGHPI